MCLGYRHLNWDRLQIILIQSLSNYVPAAASILQPTRYIPTRQDSSLLAPNTPHSSKLMPMQPIQPNPPRQGKQPSPPKMRNLSPTNFVPNPTEPSNNGISQSSGAPN